MLSSNPAERFPGDAETGSNDMLRKALQEFRILSVSGIVANGIDVLDKRFVHRVSKKNSR
jgi:hypothetical protein